MTDQLQRSLRGNANPPEHGGKKGIIWKLAGYVVGAACLAWVFYDVNPSRLLKSLTAIDWRWVGLAVVFDILGYCSQGVQWTLLLHPLGKISLLKATQAIYAGLFVNEMIPMRAGELVRVFLVSRWLSVDFVSVVPSVVVGRLFDGIWLAMGIGLTALLIHLPKDLMAGVEMLDVAVLGGVFLLFSIIFFSKGTAIVDQGRRPTFHRVMSWIDTAVQGVKAIGTTRHFYFSFAVSFLYLLFESTAFWMGARAYGIHLSLWGGVAAFLIVRLGTSIPNTPSNVGTYQFFTVLALSLFGVDKTDAAGFSVVVFVILTTPLWVIGLFAISRTGMKFRDIRQEIGILVKRKPLF